MLLSKSENKGLAVACVSPTHHHFCFLTVPITFRLHSIFLALLTFICFYLCLHLNFEGRVSTAFFFRSPPVCRPKLCSQWAFTSCFPFIICWGYYEKKITHLILPNASWNKKLFQKYLSKSWKILSTRDFFRIERQMVPKDIRPSPFNLPGCMCVPAEVMMQGIYTSLGTSEKKLSTESSIIIR